MRGSQRSAMSTVLAYGVSVAAVLAVTVAILLIGMVVRVQAFPLVYVLLVGLIAWRYGRGPALAGGLLAVALSALLFTPTLFGATASDVVRLVMLLVAALAVAQVIHLQRSSWRDLEAREAVLAGRLRLLEEISRRIVESLNADEIVRTVAEQTQRVIDYHHFRFYRYDEAGERLILAKSVARAAPYDAFSWENVAIPFGTGITGLVARTRTPILVAGASRDPRMFYPPGTERLVEAVLAVPMVAGDRFYGVLSLARLGAGTLTAEDQSLMEAIAAQSALALANAERYEAADQTIAALAAIESLEAPAADAPTHDLHQRITTTLVGLAHADAGGLRLRDSRDEHYYLVEAGPASSGVPPPGTDPVSQRDAAWLAESRAPSFITNPQTDPRLPPWAREAAVAAGVQGTVFLPLRSQNGLLGWIALHWKRPIKLDSEALNRLQLVAAQATISLQS